MKKDTGTISCGLFGGNFHKSDQVKTRPEGFPDDRGKDKIKLVCLKVDDSFSRPWQELASLVTSIQPAIIELGVFKVGIGKAEVGMGFRDSGGTFPTSHFRFPTLTKPGSRTIKEKTEP